MSAFRARRDRLGLTGEFVLAINATPCTVGRNGYAQIRCPSGTHPDRNPSASVSLSSGHFTCFSCEARGDAVDLHQLLGHFPTPVAALANLEERRGVTAPALVVATTTRRARPAAPRFYEGVRTEVARWSYVEADGTPAFDVVRVHYLLADGSAAMDERKRKPRKDYMPVPPGRRHGGMPAVYRERRPRPLFRLPELLAAPADAVAYVVEGEPCVDALVARGRIATTSSGGSHAAARSDWSSLEGRRITIWPDNDEPGLRYAAEVRRLITAQTRRCEINVIDPTVLGLPRGGDAVDWLAARTPSGEFPELPELFAGRSE